MTLGVPFDRVVAAMRDVEPHPARMQPMRLPSGAVMICDEWNGAYECYVAALDVFQDAKARRKIAVVGFVDDADAIDEEPQAWLGRRCSEIAHLCLFWGEYGKMSHEAALEAGTDASSVLWFETQKELAEHLRGLHQDGDLILLKGHWFEHLSLVYFRQVGETPCELDMCEYPSVCMRCPKLQFHPAPGGGLVPDPPPWDVKEPVSA